MAHAALSNRQPTCAALISYCPVLHPTEPTNLCCPPYTCQLPAVIPYQVVGGRGGQAAHDDPSQLSSVEGLDFQGQGTQRHMENLTWTCISDV